MDRLIILLEPHGATSESLAEKLQSIADKTSAHLMVATDEDAAGAALEEAVARAAVVVMSPVFDKPLSLSRRIARLNPKAHVILLVEPAREAALRRDAVLAAPRGGRWTILASEASSLQSSIASAIQVAEQQSRLRTTLDAVSRRMQSRPSIDAVEIRRLVVSDRYLASVLQHAHDAIVSLDRGGHVISWNAGAQRLFGLTDAEVRGRDFTTLFADADDFRATLNDARSGSDWRGEFALAAPNAATHVDAVFDRIFDETGQLAGFGVILRDITQQHQAQQTLLESSRQKDEFLAMLGHELRNPLAPIRNAAQVIALLAHENPKARSAAAIIERQVAHMTHLVDDLLDVARVTRGIVSLEREPVALADVVREAVEQVQPTLTQQGHLLSLEVQDERLSVMGDRKRLVQVVTNLLTNAAKYTDRGGNIWISLASSGSEASLTIRDDGVGIAADLLPRVFDLFAQGERPSDRALGGLGLGLALVKSLVQLHGGRVEATSPGSGGGSRFTIILPKLLDSNEAVPAEAAPVSAPNGAGLSIMVVDDNADAVQTLTMLLEMLGHRVHAETDSTVALERAAELRPDVFVLDIGMPRIDGYELAHRLRADDRLGHPTLIALTGYGQPSDVARGKEAGFDHHFVKPLDIERLDAVLRTLAASRQQPVH